MKLRTFTLNGPPPPGPLIELPPDQSRHAAAVLRLKPGQAVRLLASNGQAAPAVLEESPPSAGKVWVRLTGPWRQSTPDDSGPVHLAVALVKPAVFEVVVQKAVELGATSLIPLLTSRVRPLGAFKIDRLKKIAAEAQRQSLRNAPLELREPLSWTAFLQELAGREGLKILLAPETSGQPWPDPEPDSPLYLAVGPEGGFSPEEVLQAQRQSFSAVGLGPYILRTETAALSALAVWSYLRRRRS